jgi:osmotically-inducible protein OsmY
MKTDRQLQKDVLEELNWEPSVNSANIGVEVQDGLVTLAGHVNSFSEKWRAEEAAQRVDGVKALVVEMDVRLLQGNERTDADIARSAEYIVQWSPNISAKSIKVMVEKGWITLTGSVEWAFQKRNIGYALSNLTGVLGISNQIAIQTKAKLEAVKSDIEQALKRRASDCVKHISVMVEGSEVTLYGNVPSWSDRELVNHTAWNTAGVKNVINHILVSRQN